MEQTSDRVLAYAIELTRTERGKIKGNLYELDYAKHYERVKEKELPADTVKLIYERGERVQEAGRYFDGTPDPQLGKFERFEAVPNDPEDVYKRQLFALLGGGAAFYYFKFLKPQQNVKGDTDLEDFEFEDYDEDEPEAETGETSEDEETEEETL